MFNPCEIPVSQPLDLALNLTMGQAFRWRETEVNGISGWYSGVIYDCFFKARQTDNGIEYISNKPVKESQPILENYLRLTRDTTLTTYEHISDSDSYIAALLRKYYGTRVLRQEPWECFIAYVCSANNSINRITSIVERFSTSFGEVLSLDGDQRHRFPSPDAIVEVGEEGLEPFKLGLRRAETIARAASDISIGRLDLDELAGGPYASAKKRLMEYPGVGEKIADCVCLFSLEKPEAFPIDRHIGRALTSLCFPDLKETQIKELQKRSIQRFGNNAGLIGQLLFQESRTGSGSLDPVAKTPYFY